jgi:cob(I)alamin adenosyltransferase
VTKIYTKTGDDGTTGLPGGTRVSKDMPRIKALGSLDELNAVLGVVCSYTLPESVRKILNRIRDDLFTIGAMLSSPDGAGDKDRGFSGITDADVQSLENEIDNCETQLPTLSQFILPGGSVAGALLHLARAVARRTERCCVALTRSETVPQQILRYMNRLSDLLFVLARLVNHRDSQPEAHPTFGKHHQP